MSNKTQLQTNNTALDGYIARINAAKETAASLPEAGSSGGSSTVAETCTVTIRNLPEQGDSPICGVTALVCENGAYSNYTYFMDASVDFMGVYEITIPNVVCRSTINIQVHFYDPSAPRGIDIDGTAVFNAEWSMNSVATQVMVLSFTAPTVANENCTIVYTWEP